MLTESSLKKDNNNNSHLISSINGISVYNSILDRCIFNRDNFNLNPAQCELLKWHSQWCHCDLNRDCLKLEQLPASLAATRHVNMQTFDSALLKPNFLQFKETVHKDNMGALKFAHLEPGRNTHHSKLYALKPHWFRSWLKPKEIEIIHCPTKDQKADFLTKPLTETNFDACCFLSMGL
ncbi:hypothetical protein FRACYDRAFT_244660 [Fragilariopsis cylindrus CCMP1102]|uniref:Uncharacterized protein n=1 Tax=Fragilariopsis cylindrus CCMP1102 TaxID=635003 RepID=A0A1E7F3G1_9STRA|nr:hypothetical protein FRACYDRAFT_244660 [Fragilariopsis cylindrus CCMP1102]|eukprot:OEU12393.1 hypothetical protein FRACYDRAFT_244660 [Fragilariopsis cylindrus CCMP1102]